jgi:anti-sigma28 factor (negative regulator of flagellin synthesis)
MKKLRESESAEARTKRIATLRKAIESGTYVVSAEVLAERMFERIQDGDDSLKTLKFEVSR